MRAFSPISVYGVYSGGRRWILHHKYVLDAFVSLRKFIFYELGFRFILFLSIYGNINPPLTDLFHTEFSNVYII